MIKKLIILLTLLMVVRVDATTVYAPATTGTGSLRSPGSSSSGMERRSYKVAMDSDGDLMVIYQRPTSLVYDMVRTSDFGSTWSVAANFMNVATSPTYWGGNSWFAYSFGDSTFFTTGNENNVAALRIAMYRDTNRIYIDSQILTTNQITSGNRSAVVPLGSDRILGYTLIEDADGDSTYVFCSDAGFSEASTYTVIERSATTTGFGLRIPFTWATGKRGGLAYFDVTNNDLFWADSTTGVNSALDAGFLDAIPNTYESHWIVPVKDSIGMIVWQPSVTAGADSLLWKRFKITGVEAGTPAVSTIDSGKLEGHDKIRTGNYATPVLSTVWGTDSVYCFYKYWSDTTVDKGHDIMYRLWNGSTWGDAQTYYDVPTTRTIAYMQAPPRIYVVGTDIYQAVTFTDSTSTDNLNIALNTINVGTTPAGPTTNTVIRSAVIRGAVIR